MSESQFPSFRTIELGRTDWTRWLGSLAVHAAFVAVVIAIPWAVHKQVEARSEHVASLVDPVLLKLAVAKPVAVKRLTPPVIAAAVVIKPPVIKPTITFQAPKPQALPARKVEVQSSTPAPAPAPVQQIAVAKIEVPKPAPPVKLGGFGDPNGVQPAANASTGKLIAAKTGAFDLSEGNSHGKGSPGNRGGVVLAGFGDSAGGGGSGSGGNGRGAVRSAGFGEYDTAPSVNHAATSARAQPVETPVEITFKPKPAYTAEAREKKIEGEVLLEVIFGATGQIRIERVMRGLGFGLDERARDAAAQIRFQPGTRAGSPVDMKGIVHIVFALS